MKENQSIRFEGSFFFSCGSSRQSLRSNTATQSREALKEHSNIYSQGLLLCNLTFQIQKTRGKRFGSAEGEI